VSNEWHHFPGSQRNQNDVVFANGPDRMNANILNNVDVHFDPSIAIHVDRVFFHLALH
jgi:hypothetical protein